MEQILSAIKQMEELIDKNFDKIGKKFSNIDKKFSNIDKKINHIQVQLDRMENTLNVVAHTANDDTVSVLSRIDRNTTQTNKDIEYLSKIVGKHELYFHRMNKS